MEKINLELMAKAYYADEAKRARERAVALVENEIVPMLVNSAKMGQRFCKIDLGCRKDVNWRDVQTEVAKRVQCRLVGSGKTFSAHW